MRSFASLASPDRRVVAAARKIRVLVVDDSVVVRSLIRRALESASDVEVVGVAANGKLALEMAGQMKPDAVTLDIEMPEMNGLETVVHLRKAHPRLRIVMLSSLTAPGAQATVEALARGADDYVTKPSGVPRGDANGNGFGEQLLAKLRQFFQKSAPAKPQAASPLRSIRRPAVVAAPPKRAGRPKALLIGVSTGGPSALAEVIPGLAANLPVPVLIVQHMPPTFTRMLAERLQAHSKLRVVEASDGMPVRAGEVYIAPGNYHMVVRGEGMATVIRLNQEPQENSCRPAVDPLFRSAAAVWGGSLLALVLTGMGQDGLRGAEILKRAGAMVMAQDEESSVVWGMPGAVVQAGLADRVLPLKDIAGELMKQICHEVYPR